MATKIQYECINGKCVSTPDWTEHNVGLPLFGKVRLIAVGTDVTIEFTGKGSPFSKDINPITIAKGGEYVDRVKLLAWGRYPYKKKVCADCEGPVTNVPPEMIVP
jgi:hypothetical protein